MTHSLKTLLIAAFIVFSITPFAHASDDVVSVEPDEVALSSSDMDSRGAAAENDVVNTQSLSSTSSGNSVHVDGDLTNGAINIGSHFGSGIGSYVFNTGNNSSINSGVSVNVQMNSMP